ncbi:sulfurtransferase complex subunit TusC [Psychrosphaera sp. F3M07]|uniref:sulfurtransferase complex subunit TusC n=1 Tax=Psychrosphaera sp. F3M07 TaxID=2841560 RepID=UPI001C091DBD|nr:sulfurtransferase complex subunit TusC [Psychrosphaera sp. F3M07]MBU2917775.1 sulfurtransferase complex subunit TusC [Psychrosphaera sp. F3M07]
MTVKNILIIHTQSGLNNLQGKEALDLSLIFGAYEQNVSVLFYQQGVTQTLAQQTPELINQKDYLSTIKALGIYDIDHVFACQNSLQQFGLANHELIQGVEQISLLDIKQLKSNADHIYVV